MDGCVCVGGCVHLCGFGVLCGLVFVLVCACVYRAPRVWMCSK